MVVSPVAGYPNNVVGYPEFIVITDKVIRPANPTSHWYAPATVGQVVGAAPAIQVQLPPSQLYTLPVLG